MYQQQENLDILFRRTAPELVLENIKSQTLNNDKVPLNVGVMTYSAEAYEHYSGLNLPEYTLSEIDQRYAAIQPMIKNRDNDGIFTFLYRYAEEVLVEQDDGPKCKLEQILNWHSIALRLGEDIFVTAWIARRDSRRKGMGSCKREFVWPSIIKTDDRRLEELFRKGLAENHFHLNGSTQVFPVSWACLMNHPEKIEHFFKNSYMFKRNMSNNIGRGTIDNVLGWAERIRYAAWIRVLLFQKCMGRLKASEVRTQFCKIYQQPIGAMLYRKVSETQYMYGVKFRGSSGNRKYLDYACSARAYLVDETKNNRLLAGERVFLYQCFINQYQGKFTNLEASLFYLYLLIKSHFRSELVQINKRMGFQNFSDYQDRKNMFFGELDEYWEESQRIAILAGEEDNHLISLETRITPQDTDVKMKGLIDSLDNMVKVRITNWFNDQQEDVSPELMHYYVIHFIKKKFNAGEFEKYPTLLYPRNVEVRNKIRQQAHALSGYINKYDMEKMRVWGIDASSLEIGCRPETFATEFRYLRGSTWDNVKQCWYKKTYQKHAELGVTYHAGEDFLDIADGLRTIDEAMIFLEMKKDDRIGHALAMGIDAEQFYELKHYNIYLPKQDYLDNLVWLLYRTLELNVSIDPDKRTHMEGEARRLICEIYPPEMHNSVRGDLLDTYYQSWQLRGDHPSLYVSGKFQPVKEKLYDRYEVYMKRTGDWDKYRTDESVARMYYYYHFDNASKRRGLEIAEMNDIRPWYVEMISRVQNVLRRKVAEKGICIECNPSSNVLIGSFFDYHKHPILQFNDHYLEDAPDKKNIYVSINTDDLGVFDTSLENEYALMYQAIIEKRHKEGIFSDEAVLDYLNYIRECGINMSFKRARQSKKEVR